MTKAAKATISPAGARHIEAMKAILNLVDSIRRCAQASIESVERGELRLPLTLAEDIGATAVKLLTCSALAVVAIQEAPAE